MDKQLRIMFDIDGVLMNFSDTFIPWYNDNYPDDRIADNWNTYDYGGKKDLGAKIKRYSDEGWLLRQDPIPNAVEIFNKISAQHTVVVITNRHPDNIQDTITRMQQLGFHISGNMIYATGDKATLVLDLRLDVCIDDAAHHANAIMAMNPNIHMFVPVERYNKGLSGKNLTYYKHILQLPNLLEELYDDE